MVTITSTVPVAWAGEVTAMDVAVSVTTVAVAVPNLTLVALARLVPVMVTEVPPPLDPEVGATAVTVGAAT